ncbi:MAG: DUF6305 family protein [Calditerricola sp.]|nr:DUF6305 family protein [Calditerricola sp.]
MSNRCQRPWIVPALLVVLALAWAYREAIATVPAREWTLPHLPVPVAREPALITSAGQGVDVHALAHLADTLHIDGDVRPHAEARDVSPYRSVLLAVGYSPAGLAAAGRNWEAEVRRAQEIARFAHRSGVPLILVFFGGPRRADARSTALLDLLLPYARYVIARADGDQDRRIASLARRHDVPYTRVRTFEAAKIPLNSVYR